MCKLNHAYFQFVDFWCLMPYSPVGRYVFQRNVPPSSGSGCARDGCIQVARQVASQIHTCEKAEVAGLVNRKCMSGEHIASIFRVKDVGNMILRNICNHLAGYLVS
jgi:hypothetical protein